MVEGEAPSPWDPVGVVPTQSMLAELAAEATAPIRYAAIAASNQPAPCWRLVAP
jgi:hypothetical protein